MRTKAAHRAPKIAVLAHRCAEMGFAKNLVRLVPMIADSVSRSAGMEFATKKSTVPGAPRIVRPRTLAVETAARTQGGAGVIRRVSDMEIVAMMRANNAAIVCNECGLGG